METILKPLTVTLLFESDRLACSIFTPLMLGVNEMRCSTFPPGRSEFNLQGKPERAHKLNTCKDFREINGNDWIIWPNVIYSVACFTTHPAFLRCSVMFCLWTLIHLVLFYDAHYLLTNHKVKTNNPDSYLNWVLPFISPAPVTVRTPLTGWENGLMNATAAVCSLFSTMESLSATWKKRKVLKMYKWKCNNLGFHSLLFARVL